MQDLIAGRYDYICTLSPTGKPLIEGNRVKGIAIMPPKRSPELPNLPSTAEQGLPNFEVSTWFGLFFPKGTPEPIIDKLNAALGETLDTLGARAVQADCCERGPTRSAIAGISEEGSLPARPQRCAMRSTRRACSSFGNS